MKNLLRSVIYLLAGLLLLNQHVIAEDVSPNWGAMSDANKTDQTNNDANKNKLPRGTSQGCIGKPGETYDQRETRMAWWRDAHFGMFIHWGLYAQAAGSWDGKKINSAEWIQCVGRIKGEDYAKLAKDFKAEKFNAAEWVKIAKDAGMKYIVITAKHHDGFAMFDSKASDYNIVKMTPFGRDPVKELAEECKKQGLKLGIYYSQNLDWQDPNARGNGWEFNDKGADFPKYMKDKALPQIRELLTNYGDILEFWFDFPSYATEDEMQTFTKLCWELQPNILLNGRASGSGCTRIGDFITPEQSMPGDGSTNDSEACMTMNEAWGYREYDHDWKPAYNLIRNLINTTSKSGNFLLNVGPKGDGTIPEGSVERLQEVGKWMSVNSDSVYGTVNAGLGAMPWGRLTAKPGKLYLHVFEWPANGEIEVPIANTEVTAKILSAPDAKPQVKNGKNYLTISDLPKEMPDKSDTVIELTFSGDIKRGAFRGQRLMCPDLEDAYPEGWSSFRADDYVTGTLALAGERSLKVGYQKHQPKKGSRMMFQIVHINPGDKLQFSALVKTTGCATPEGKPFAKPQILVDIRDINGKVLKTYTAEPELKGDVGPVTETIKDMVAPPNAENVMLKIVMIITKENEADAPKDAEPTIIADNFSLTCEPAE